MSDPLAGLMPHRPPMRWIEALERVDETTAVATACLSEEDLPVSEGRVLESAWVECMAQTVAAAAGFRGHRAPASTGPGTLPGGRMLVAVTRFTIRSRPAAGRRFRIEVREARRLGPMMSVEGTVWCEGDLIASGELKLYGE